MNGLELSRGYWETYGRPMLERDFPALMPYIAVGFVGSGSEHYGFDDEISRDHDFEPGFCLFLPDEQTVSRRDAFRLERAYAGLPKEYNGAKRQILSPVGGNRHGVIRTADFYTSAVGAADGCLSLDEWLHIPDYALAEATNGQVFFDGYGEFTRIRLGLQSMPEDVRLKRLAGNLLVMAQAGPYNFNRCLRHGEAEAAQLACGEFINSAMRVAFLLERQYMPYYKWSFRALRALRNGQPLAAAFSCLLKGDNQDPQTAAQKSAVIDRLIADTIAAVQAQGLSDTPSDDMEACAYAVNNRIGNGELRNQHILAGI